MASPPPPAPPIDQVMKKKPLLAPNLGDLVHSQDVENAKLKKTQPVSPKPKTEDDITRGILEQQGKLKAAAPVEKPAQSNELLLEISSGISRLRKVGERRGSMGAAGGLQSSIEQQRNKLDLAAANTKEHYRPMANRPKKKERPAVVKPKKDRGVLKRGENWCDYCDNLIPVDTECMEASGSFYHVNCFNCSVCTKHIEGEFLLIGPTLYHPTCLACKICKTPLVAKKIHSSMVDFADTALYCQEHAPRPICTVCNKTIPKRVIEKGDNSFHPECFQCSGCGVSVADIPFITADDTSGLLRHCEKCHSQLFSDKCGMCNKAIEGKSVKLKGKTAELQYHISCYRCFACKTTLTGHKSYMHDDHVYCQKDFLEVKKQEKADARHE